MTRGFAGWAVLALFGFALQGQELVCSPDRPAIMTGGSVNLRVWLPADQAAQYVWNAKTGTLTVSGATTRWSFDDVDPGVYEAVARKRGLASDADGCTVQVLVLEEVRGATEAFRSFLVKGDPQTPGYGLYSYLLLGIPPSPVSRSRYLKVIGAWLNLIPDIVQAAHDFTRDKINITYLPITVSPPDEPTAEWVLDHYDYGFARAVLDTLSGTHRQGPYIISASAPVGKSISRPFLYQDLSVVPADEDLASWWVTAFLNQAAQQHYWEAQTLPAFVLKVRTAIEILAIGLPEVQKQVEASVKLTH